MIDVTCSAENEMGRHTPILRDGTRLQEAPGIFSRWLLLLGCRFSCAWKRIICDSGLTDLCVFATVYDFPRGKTFKATSGTAASTQNSQKHELQAQ